MMGHLDICSSQSGDPEKCPVCKTRPPFVQRPAARLGHGIAVIREISAAMAR